VTPVSHRYYDLLAANPSYPKGSREARDDRFTSQQLQGQPVLLIDDQWTSGGRVQSAAAALRIAGSGPVAVVVLGRHFDSRPNGDIYLEAAQTYLRAAIKQGWNWDRCCLQT
jgi:orotate phosphoribosyltransferase